METGELLMIISAGPVVPSFADTSLSTHEGLVWLLAAIIADILPVASGQFHVPVFSTDRHFSSQVFICLDLNCRFPFCPLFRQRILMIRFDSVRISAPLDEVRYIF